MVFCWTAPATGLERLGGLDPTAPGNSFFFHFWYRLDGFWSFASCPGTQWRLRCRPPRPVERARRVVPALVRCLAPMQARSAAGDRVPIAQRLGGAFLGFALLVLARVSPQVTWCGPGRRPTPGHDGVVCLAVGISTRDGWRSIQQTNGATEAQARRGGAFFFFFRPTFFF